MTAVFFTVCHGPGNQFIVDLIQCVRYQLPVHAIIPSFFR